MSQKIYIKPPEMTRSTLITLIVLTALFLPLGAVFIIISEGEVRPFAAIFSLIWTAACIGIIIQSVKALKLIKKGNIEIAHITEKDSS
jgi:hypothetical protein